MKLSLTLPAALAEEAPMFDLAIRSVIPGCTLPGYCGGYYTRVRFHDGQCVYGSQRSYGPPSWRWFFATGKKMRVDESA